MMHSFQPQELLKTGLNNHCPAADLGDFTLPQALGAATGSAFSRLWWFK